LEIVEVPLNWDEIVKHVTAEEVYPLFYKNLDKLRFARISPHTQAKLQSLLKINAFRNTLLREELVQVLHILRQGGVPTIPLKGLPLAEFLYGDTAARVCCDIDVLVPKQFLCKAFALLTAAGFEQHDQKLQESDFDALLNSNIQYSFVRKHDGTIFFLELH